MCDNTTGGIRNVKKCSANQDGLNLGVKNHGGGTKVCKIKLGLKSNDIKHGLVINVGSSTDLKICKKG